MCVCVCVCVSVSEEDGGERAPAGKFRGAGQADNTANSIWYTGCGMGESDHKSQAFRQSVSW